MPPPAPSIVDVMSNEDFVGAIGMAGGDRRFLSTLAEVNKAGVGAMRQYEQLKKTQEKIWICSKYYYDKEKDSNYYYHAKKRNCNGALSHFLPAYEGKETITFASPPDSKIKEYSHLKNWVKNPMQFLAPLERMCKERIYELHIIEGHSDWKYYESAIENNVNKAALRHMFECTRELTHHGSRLKYFCLAIKSGSFSHLEKLRFETDFCKKPGIGDAGLEKIADAVTTLINQRKPDKDPDSEEALPLSELKELNLLENNVGDAGMVALSSVISSVSMRNLENLDLDKNSIGHEGMRAFASASGSLKALTSLSLNSNQIGDAGMGELAGALSAGSLRSLRELHLNKNKIGNTGMAAFSGKIGSLTGLESLALNDNAIGDEGMTAFADASRSLASLKKLLLAENQVGDAGMTEFSSAISSGSLARLQGLILSDNQIGDAGMAKFSVAIASGSLSELQVLWLNGNKIGNAGMADFSSAINLPTNRNSWTRFLWTRLPLASLRNLDLHANPFDHLCVAALARVLVNKQVLAALLVVQVDTAAGHLIADVLRARKVDTYQARRIVDAWEEGYHPAYQVDA